MLNFRKRRIYLDTAAATPVDPSVKNAMSLFMDKNFGNPASIHREGVAAFEAIRQARQTVADILGGRENEVIFTSGGTESNNLAVKGVACKYQKEFKEPGKILLGATEHKSLIEPVRQLTEEGWELEFLPVDQWGLIKSEDLERSLDQNTALVSIGLVNNEIGVIQPLKELAKVIRRFRKAGKIGQYPLFHTDACQAGRFLSLNTKYLGVDLLTANGGKIYGPKGVGLLWRRTGVDLEPMLTGGGQEYFFRSGTENVPAVIGFSVALKLAEEIREVENSKLAKLQEYLIDQVLMDHPAARLNGSRLKRVAGNVNLSFPGTEAELLVLRLDAAGIACSTGSACATYGHDQSHVLKALGLSQKEVDGAVRFSLGRDTTYRDIDHLVSVLSEALEKEKLLG